MDAFWQAKAEYDRPNGRKFSVDSPEDCEFVEQIYNRLGADTAALHAVVGRTGILPDAALDTMKGQLGSKDPAKVAKGMADLGRLTRNFPSLLSLGDSGKADLQNDLSEFRFYRRQGLAEDQAAKLFIDARSPEGEARRIEQLKSIDVDAAVIRATSMSNIDRLFGGNPALTQAVLSNYRDLVRERIVATGNPDLARAQTNDQMKPLLDAAAEDADQKEAASRPSWIGRAWLNGLDAFYRGTLLGASQLRALADMARFVEATPDMETKRQELLDKFYPALRHSKWGELHEARWQEIKTAPERHKKILADLKRYDEMRGFNSASEFGAAALGQIVASMLSPESYAGWSVKGASWGVRALKAAIQQAGIAGVADLETQRNLVEAGVQPDIDRWRTIGAAATAGGFAAIGSRIGGAKD